MRVKHSAALLFTCLASIVLAQKDETTSASPPKYGMGFSVDTDGTVMKPDKRFHVFGVPGEYASAAVTDAPQTSATSTDAPTTTVSSEEDITTVKSSDDANKSVSDLNPVEGALSALNSGGANPEGEEEKVGDENDQRIVFIERLMGLHLTSPQGDNSQSVLSQGSPSEIPTTESPTAASPQNKLNAKWASRTRKFSIPISDPNQGMQEPPNPMLKFAAAAMMSRLIAAAARAQMEAQARDATTSGLSRSGPKDKDDDAENDESVPVLLASLRDERMMAANPMRHMYGRPMPRDFMRGAQRNPAMSSILNHRVVPPSSPQGMSSQGVHPLMQQLQALQSISAMQRMQQRQREGRGQMTEMEGPSKGQPALVMVAIPMQGQESRQSPYQSQYAAPSPYGPAPVNFAPRSYYQHPYASPYTSPAYRPLSHPSAASYAVPVHVPIPTAAHYPLQSHPHAAYYRPTHSYSPYPPMRSSSSLHPAYSPMRHVIEVPVEVPVPVHVPVPVAYPTLHPMSHREHIPHHHHPMSRADDPEASDSDQIVLFYDAELHDDPREDNNGADDLQSSASELKPMGPKAHQFMTGHQLPQITSMAKLKLFRELMNAKHSSQPGVRYMPIAIASSDDQPQFPQPHKSPFQAQDSPAFIVLSDDQPVERRR